MEQQKVNLECKGFSFSSSSYLYIKILITKRAVSGMRSKMAEMLKLEVKKSMFILKRNAFRGCSCSVGCTTGKLYPKEYLNTPRADRLFSRGYSYQISVRNKYCGMPTISRMWNFLDEKTPARKRRSTKETATMEE